MSDQMNSNQEIRLELDEFHYHELMDRTNCILETVEWHLEEHPVSQEHPDIRVKLNQVGELLADVYQKAGSHVFEKFEKKEED